MKKLKGEVEGILKLAGAVIADKGFQGSGYVTPAKKPKDRELYFSTFAVMRLGFPRPGGWR